jgi:hypothetical protein
MIRKFIRLISLSSLTVLLISFRPLVANAGSAIVAGNNCNNNHVAGLWDSYHEFAYLTNKNITTQPLWCIINNAQNTRLVFQANGDLVVWSGLHSGGSVLWLSNTGNRGATQLRFQSDGNVVIYAGSNPLWASSWYIGAWQGCNGYTTKYQLNLENHAISVGDLSMCDYSSRYVAAW